MHGRQTLATIKMIGTFLSEEQRGKAKVQSALAEGVMCPALVELVCEVLACSGKD